MRSLHFILFIALVPGVCIECVSQKSQVRYLDSPVWTDSASTLFIPTLYNNEFLSSNKLAASGGYYANILVYNFVTDSYRKLFEADTYIKDFRSRLHYPLREDTLTNMSAHWVFLLVKNNDFNRNGRIDEMDPSTLYVVNRRGDTLKPVTSKNEHVVSFQIFEKQGFAFVRLQRDSNYDELFDGSDKDIYLRRIDLEDCALGKPIETGTTPKKDYKKGL
jgi:hypothetical protein